MNFPSKILMADGDGGYFKAILDKEIEDADENSIPVYKQIEYYHSLESAIRDF